MDCKTAAQQNLDNLKELQRIFVANRTPATGSINLTQRCNLNCVHCYLGKPHSKLRSQEDELDTQQWLSIIDQITKAGCLYLLLSGGEVLLRHDFEDIYQKAVENGLLVTVFTNGTLISDKILSLFENLPPQIVEISLYGATPSTYETVTRVKGSFEKSLTGIRKLSQRGIKLKLKTMILRQNFHELGEIKKIADQFGVEFIMDPAVSACLDGDRTPITSRVDAAQAVQADFSDPVKAKRWQEYYQQADIEPESDYLYSCGAGLTHFHINPAGSLLPCMILTKPAFDLTSGNFLDGWQNEIFSLRKIKAGPDYLCNKCEKSRFCSTCPAFFELENNSPEKHSQYLCDLAEQRIQTIESNLFIEKKPST
jgi:MoaA/NifB/PqqE/SkfB family radical SAM enzyme